MAYQKMVSAQGHYSCYPFIVFKILISHLGYALRRLIAARLKRYISWRFGPSVTLRMDCFTGSLPSAESEMRSFSSLSVYVQMLGRTRSNSSQSNTNFQLLICWSNLHPLHPFFLCRTLFLRPGSGIKKRYPSSKVFEVMSCDTICGSMAIFQSGQSAEVCDRWNIDEKHTASTRASTG